MLKKAYKTKNTKKTYKLGIHKISFQSKKQLGIDSSTLVFDKYSAASSQTSVFFSMGFLAFTRNWNNNYSNNINSATHQKSIG